ncbi:MAG TPA: glycosyltransferase family 2 protein [Candidatus Binatia bacterium]|nr:glycosyltransferase family 2 protein [Candidatus Binatia bacterium]
MSALAIEPRGPASETRDLLLPVPPADGEKHLYVHRQVSVLLVSSLISVICLTASQYHLLRLHLWLWVLAPFLVFTLLYYLVSLRVTLTSRNFNLATHRALVAAWTPLSYPTVDVWLPICGEDLAMLANTWHHVDRLRQAYPGRVTVYVLDDGDDPEAATLAAAHGFRHLVRPNRGWLKKAGNLRHGYHNSDSEFIVIFDADFSPREDFLAETLPYMQRYPELGIVQTPQYFRADARQTWMERGAGAVQELFYRVTQVSRDRLDAAICVGSCGVYRRVALDAIGGTTLIEHSEDVHTGFDLRRHGWGLRYLPIPLATGMCPAGPDSFLTQQYRWCMGSMSLLGSRKFWTARLRLSARCCYLSGFGYYMQTAAASIVTPLVAIFLLALLPDQIQLRNYLWIAPSATFLLVIFPLWNRCRYGPTALMAKSLYGWAHLFAITDILRGRRQPWQTTGARSRRPTGRIWRAVALWGGTAAAVWLLLAVYRMLTMSAVNFVFLLVMGLIYSWTAVLMPFIARAQARRRS